MNSEQNRTDRKRMRKGSEMQLHVIARRIDVLRELIGPVLDLDPIINAVAMSHARMMTFNVRQCLADMITHQSKEKKVLITELVNMNRRSGTPKIVTVVQKDAG